jgi:hypothetical protein
MPRRQTEEVLPETENQSSVKALWNASRGLAIASQSYHTLVQNNGRPVIPSPASRREENSIIV